MKEQYTESDFQKLNSVIATFETLEKHLGSYVECRYQEQSYKQGYEPMFLYSVERFRKIELNYYKEIFIVEFVSSNQIIQELTNDDTREIIYSNNIVGMNAMSGEQIDLENYYDKMERDFVINGETKEKDRIKLAELEEKYRKKLEKQMNLFRRESFGNIIADIEEEFYRENGFNIYDSTKIDYIAALDYYESKMPKGYTIYPKDSSRSSHL